MDQQLRHLLNQLDRIGQSYPEIYGRRCREALTQAVFNVFVKPVSDYHLGDEFGLRDRDGDQVTRNALLDYCAECNEVAAKTGLSSFRSRLLAFQNDDVSSEAGSSHSDFFIWVNPDFLDEDGNFERAD